MESKTQFQKIIFWFQNHRLFAWLLVVFVFISGISTLASSIDTLVRVYNNWFGQKGPPMIALAREDIRPLKDLTSHAWLYDIDGNEVEALPGEPNSLMNGNVSQLQLCENGKTLKSDLNIDKIIKVGGGIFNHWYYKNNDKDHSPPNDCWSEKMKKYEIYPSEAEYIIFSTTDNSDPTTNGRKYKLKHPNGQVLILDNSKIQKYRKRSKAFGYSGKEINLTPADKNCDDSPQTSKLIVKEIKDGKTITLGSPHTHHSEIAEQGMGRYQFCRDGTGVWLYFSTPDDGGDPRDCDREYFVTVEK